MFGANFQSTPTDGDIAAGVIGGTFTSPSDIMQNGMATLSALGPISQPYTDPAARVLPGEMAASIAYGVEANWDLASMQQVGPVIKKIRMRAWNQGSLQHTIDTGAHLFSSIVPSIASPDKVTVVTPPILNDLFRQRAEEDARAEALGTNSIPGSHEELSVLQQFTPLAPSGFLQKWAYLGAAVEPGQSNGVAEEPLWGFAVPGLGEVKMANIFSENIQLGDYCYFIVNFKSTGMQGANPYTPQPRQVLQITGCASKTIPCRNSSKDGVPRATDVDSIQQQVLVPREWRESKYNPLAPSGQKWTTEIKVPLNRDGASSAVSEFIGGKLKMDRYEPGVIICVGQVVEKTPRNPSAKLRALAHHNIGAYKELPLITVTPFTRIH